MVESLPPAQPRGDHSLGVRTEPPGGGAARGPGESQRARTVSQASLPPWVRAWRSWGTNDLPSGVGPRDGSARCPKPLPGASWGLSALCVDGRLRESWRPFLESALASAASPSPASPALGALGVRPVVSALSLARGYPSPVPLSPSHFWQPPHSTTPLAPWMAVSCTNTG